MIRKRARRDALPVNAEINLTNLIDVAFVLLIIFMITAPILQGGVPLELPEADATPMESNDPVVVSVTLDGTYYIGEAPVAFEELAEQVKRVAGDRRVSVRVDRGVPSQDMIAVFAALMAEGITKLDIPVKPIDR